MRLSLCMIVRDNEAIIEECLNSICPWVDEMIVVDTGSKDDTVRIAEKLGAEVSTLEWVDDFSAARNASFERASGEWIFWMDSDDVIDEVCGKRLRELADDEHDPDVLGYVAQVHCPGAVGAEGGDVTVVDHVKLIRNRPDLRFEGRIHEQILASIRRAGGEVGWTDIFVTHKHGSVTPEDRKRKHQRDLRILKQDLADRPEHPFVLFNLGMTYADMEQPKEAIDYLRRSIAAAQPDESHLPKANALLAACLLQTDQTAAAIEVCQRACEMFPDDTELQFRHALALHQTGQSEQAITIYRKILDPADDAASTQSFKSRDAGIGGHKARHNLAIIYSERKQHARAELQWRYALDEAPYFQSALMGLAESLTQQDKWQTAQSTAERWRQDARTTVVGAWLASQSHVHSGEVEQAISVLRSARSENADNTELLDALCKICFEAGKLDEAEATLKEMAILKPVDGAVRHNLGAVCLQLGRSEEAVQYLEESLRLRPDSPATEQLLASARGPNQSP